MNVEYVHNSFVISVTDVLNINAIYYNTIDDMNYSKINFNYSI